MPKVMPVTTCVGRVCAIAGLATRKAAGGAFSRPAARVAGGLVAQAGKIAGIACLVASNPKREVARVAPASRQPLYLLGGTAAVFADIKVAVGVVVA